MKKYSLLALFGMLLIAGRAQPPNNLIFYGGTGDGSNNNTFFAAANGIFAGGPGDGINAASNNALSNTIFSGSAGDGFAGASNNVLANTIFLGSNGDGFSHQSNNVSPNPVFSGSVGDGFSTDGNNALPNSIYKGGEGDGWHAVLLPLGPLPVKLLSFTAQYAGTAHLVKWTTTEEINTRHFEVQHSANGVDFVNMGNVAAIGGSLNGASYSFTVRQPWPGNNFYRLKITDNDGSFEYSSIVLLKEESGLQLVVYPNPTAALLYVQIPANNSVSAISAMIYDANGKTVIRATLKPGNSNSIHVGQLPAGMYTLTCIINDQPFTIRFVKGRL